MVQLTLTPAAKAALDESRRRLHLKVDHDTAVRATLDRLGHIEVGGPIDHVDLTFISANLNRERESPRIESGASAQWRLDSLLKGAKPYRPPLPPKPEPTAEYKALMKRLREEEERRQYERMLEPSSQPTPFSPNSPDSRASFNPALSIGQAASASDADEVTYADVNRQLALIINVLISIVACSVAIWIAARRWSVPQRLGLSLTGSAVVAIAEVAIYMGYIRRIQDAKTREANVVETKEVVETWVLDRKSRPQIDDSVRYRKGKHR